MHQNHGVLNLDRECTEHLKSITNQTFGGVEEISRSHKIRELLGQERFCLTKVGKDGNCGAYIMAVVNYVVTNGGTRKTQSEIRDMISNVASRQLCCYLSSVSDVPIQSEGALSDSWKDNLRTMRRVIHKVFLDEFHLGIAAKHMGLNMLILFYDTSHKTWKASVCSNSNSASGWVIATNTDSNLHWELLVLDLQDKNYAFVYTNDEMRRIVQNMTENPIFWREHQGCVYPVYPVYNLEFYHESVRVNDVIFIIDHRDDDLDDEETVVPRKRKKRKQAGMERGDSKLSTLAADMLREVQASELLIKMQAGSKFRNGIMETKKFTDVQVGIGTGWHFAYELRVGMVNNRIQGVCLTFRLFVSKRESFGFELPSDEDYEHFETVKKTLELVRRPSMIGELVKQLRQTLTRQEEFEKLRAIHEAAMRHAEANWLSTDLLLPSAGK